MILEWKNKTGEYSCLKVDLLFKREFSYYLIQIYIPCCMLVIVSWVSFWLDQSAVPARVSLGTNYLLTLSTISRILIGFYFNYGKQLAIMKVEF